MCFCLFEFGSALKHPVGFALGPGFTELFRSGLRPKSRATFVAFGVESGERERKRERVEGIGRAPGVLG